MRLTFFIAAVILLSAFSGRAETFLAGFEDVPLMPGIVVDREAVVAFDTPAGRIVEAYASGDVTQKAVQQFYQTALPQLGWTRTGVLDFSRDGERLSLELLGEPDAVTIRFELGPVPTK